MSKVFFDVVVSIDGFIAGPDGSPKKPLGEGGSNLSQWLFSLKSFREHLQMQGGESGSADDEIVRKTFDRIGANIMGKRMFDEGEANWPENAPFRNSVFVLTNEKRTPWERPGGTVFYFVNERIEDVLERAKEAAGSKDIRISGGANLIQQYFNAGLIDEFTLHIVPYIMGKGVRLFENTTIDRMGVEIIDVVNSPMVTHLQYKVNNNKK